MMRKKQYFYHFIFLLASFLLAGCLGTQVDYSCQSKECSEKRAQIVSVESVDYVTKDVSELNDKLIGGVLKLIFPKARQIFHDIEKATFDYDVQFQKVVYNTIGPNGKIQKANALIVAPVVKADHFQPKPLVSYQHISGNQPTKFTKIFPINFQKLPSIASIVGWLLASKGYVFVATDQIGYGTDAQVYLQKAEGYAVLDLIKAVRDFKLKNPGKVDWQFNHENMLMGYSEGGYAAIAANNLAKQEQIDLSDVYAGSGAYNLNGTLLNTLEIVTGQVQPGFINIKEQFSFLKSAFIGYLHYNPDLPQDLGNYVRGDKYNLRFAQDYIAGRSSINSLVQNNTLSFKDIRTSADNKIHLFHGKQDQLVPFFNFEEVGKDLVSSKMICQLVTQPGFKFNKLGAHQECFLLFVDHVYGQLTGNQHIYSVDSKKQIGSYLRYGF